jgi:hypothetical protein
VFNIGTLCRCETLRKTGESTPELCKRLVPSTTNINATILTGLKTHLSVEADTIELQSDSNRTRRVNIDSINVSYQEAWAAVFFFFTFYLSIFVQFFVSVGLQWYYGVFLEINSLLCQLNFLCWYNYTAITQTCSGFRCLLWIFVHCNLEASFHWVSVTFVI